MNGLLRMVLIVTGLLWMIEAHAAVGGVSGLHCRVAPRTNAKVVGRLRRGQEVSVTSTEGKWSRVDPPRLTACWVPSDLLASTMSARIGQPALRGTGRTKARARADRSYARSLGIYRAARNSHATRSARSSARRSRSRPLYEGGGSCPCSGRDVCIGPRGGRYCITSGGNKRYGV
jgi:hypothetical protein